MSELLYMCVAVLALIVNIIKQKNDRGNSVTANAIQKADGRIGIATLVHPVIP